MINEEQILNEILEEGKHIRSVPFFVDILSRHFKETENDIVGIRYQIEMWARRHNIVILEDINNDIKSVFYRSDKIRPFSPIPITERDINYIKQIKGVGRQRVMFAFLMLGKANADQFGTVRIIVIPFSDWIGFANESNLYTRHLPWLIENYYIEDLTEHYRLRGQRVRDGVKMFRVAYLNTSKDQTKVIDYMDSNDFNKWFNKYFT